MSVDDKTEQRKDEAASDLEPSDGVEIDTTTDDADEALQDDETTTARRDLVDRRQGRAPPTAHSRPADSRPASAGVRCAGGVVVLRSVPA